MKILKQIWDYFRPSWEDDSGHLSYKRLSQFLWSWLIIYMVLKQKVSGQWEFYTLLALIVLFAITGALITIPQLIEMIKQYSTGMRRRSLWGGLEEMEDTENQAENTQEIVENK